MGNPETATRAYPVDVIDMGGKTVKAGDPVELPIAKVKEHELRFGLSSDDRGDASQVKKQGGSTGGSLTTETKPK